MKTRNLLFLLATSGMLVWATGCEKKEATIQDPAQDATDAASAAVKKGTEAMPETGAKVAANVGEKAREVAAPAQDLAAPAGNKAQELIDAAMSLVAAGKLQEALGKLKALGAEKLSPTQQSLVDALKAQIQKALGAAPPTATDAAGAAGNLLKK